MILLSFICIVHKSYCLNPMIHFLKKFKTFNYELVKKKKNRNVRVLENMAVQWFSNTVNK